MFSPPLLPVTYRCPSAAGERFQDTPTDERDFSQVFIYCPTQIPVPVSSLHNQGAPSCDKSSSRQNAKPGLSNLKFNRVGSKLLALRRGLKGVGLMERQNILCTSTAFESFFPKLDSFIYSAMFGQSRARWSTSIALQEFSGDE